MSRHELRDELRARLLGQAAELPTSTAARFGHTAVALLGPNGLFRRMRQAARGGEPEEIDVESLLRLITRFGRLKGVAMKMGQILSYVDVALPEEVRVALSTLQTHAQPMAFEQVRAIVESELGVRADALLDSLATEPVAAASIGQVHRGRLADGTPVAVKVQYPEVEAAIESDFGPAALGSAMASLFYPGARIDGFIREARERFVAECDYRREAGWQQRFAERFRDDPVIVVPAVYPEYCGRRVLTTGWIDGARFDDFLATEPSEPLRDRVGEALFRFYLGSLFRFGLYNCDPHPGNYLILPEGRVALLDYGCCRDFDADFVAKLAALTRAVQDDDREQLHEALVALAIVQAGKRYDYPTARELFRSFHGPMLRDEVIAFETGRPLGMAEIGRKKREIMRLALPGELLFLFRIRFGLVSVLARLGARANWYRLERSYADGVRASAS